MKAIDITPGWYYYEETPNGRWGAKDRVYVFQQAPRYVAGRGSFSPFDPEDEEQPLTTVTDPVTGETLKVPARVKSRRMSRGNQTNWVVGRLRTGVTDDVYVEDEDGNYVEDENGEWTVKESRVLPDYWEFAVVRAVQIISTWQDKVDLDAKRKAYREERAEQLAQEAKAAREKAVSEAVARADALTGLGVALADFLSPREVSTLLRGDADVTLLRVVDAVIKALRASHSVSV